MKILCINSKPDLSFFTKRGLILDVSYDTCDTIFPPIKTSEVINTIDGKDVPVQIYSPDVYAYLNEKYKEKYHYILFGWYPKDYGTDFKQTGGQAFMKKLSSSARFATARQDGGNYEVHEMMHLLVYTLYYDLKKYDVTDAMDTTFVNGVPMRYYKNNDLEAPDGNFAITWDSIKKYVPLLNSLDMQNPTLKKGSKGEAVKELQTLLGGLVADGIFGVKTEAAVKVFQVKNGLIVDGIVGKNTWASLKKKPKLDLSKWGLLPGLETIAVKFLEECENAGYNLKITQGYRSQEEQNEKYAQGRTKPGPIVTWTKKSKHTERAAFDVAFVGKNPYPKNFDWEKIGIIGEKLGLKWGGRWKVKDLVHFEL